MPRGEFGFGFPHRLTAAAVSVAAWILAAGSWDDTGVWDDTAVWKDA